MRHVAIEVGHLPRQRGAVLPDHVDRNGRDDQAEPADANNLFGCDQLDVLDDPAPAGQGDVRIDRFEDRKDLLQPVADDRVHAQIELGGDAGQRLEIAGAVGPFDEAGPARVGERGAAVGCRLGAAAEADEDAGDAQVGIADALAAGVRQPVAHDPAAFLHAGPGGADAEARAHGEQVALPQLAIDRDGFGRGPVAFVDAGDADRIVGLHRALQAGDALGEAEAGYALEEIEIGAGPAVAIDDDAGRLAGGWITLDLDVIGGDGGIAIDAEQRQGPAVERRVARRLAPVGEHRGDADGVVRRGAVELGAVRHALLGKGKRATEVIGRLAHRHGDDPGARRRAAGRRRDDVEHVGDAAGGGQ